MKNNLTKHHIIAREFGGTNNPKNIIKLPRDKHKSLHGLHGNLLPHEQLEHSLSINATTLTDEFKEAVRYLLNVDREFIYEKGIIKPNYLKK